MSSGAGGNLSRIESSDSVLGTHAPVFAQACFPELHQDASVWVFN